MKGDIMKKSIKDKKNEYIREEIFSIAKEIVSKEGIDNLSIRKIAKKIGYSPRNIYQYYENKDAIIEEILKEGYIKLIKSISIEPKKDLSMIDQIKFKFENYAKAAFEIPEIYREIMVNTSTNILKYTGIFQNKNKQKGIQQLEMYLDKAVKNKEVKPMNTEEVSLILWSSIVGIILRSIIEKNKDEKKVLNMIGKTIDIVLKD